MHADNIPVPSTHFFRKGSRASVEGIGGLGAADASEPIEGWGSSSTGSRPTGRIRRTLAGPDDHVQGRVHRSRDRRVVRESLLTATIGDAPRGSERIVDIRVIDRSASYRRGVWTSACDRTFLAAAEAWYLDDLFDEGLRARVTSFFPRTRTATGRRAGWLPDREGDPGPAATGPRASVVLTVVGSAPARRRGGGGEAGPGIGTGDRGNAADPAAGGGARPLFRRVGLPPRPRRGARGSRMPRPSSTGLVAVTAAEEQGGEVKTASTRGSESSDGCLLASYIQSHQGVLARARTDVARARSRPSDGVRYRRSMCDDTCSGPPPSPARRPATAQEKKRNDPLLRFFVSLFFPSPLSCVEGAGTRERSSFCSLRAGARVRACEKGPVSTTDTESTPHTRSDEIVWTIVRLFIPSSVPSRAHPVRAPPAFAVGRSPARPPVARRRSRQRREQGAPEPEHRPRSGAADT